MVSPEHCNNTVRRQHLWLMKTEFSGKYFVKENVCGNWAFLIVIWVATDFSEVFTFWLAGALTLPHFPLPRGVALSFTQPILEFLQSAYIQHT